MGLQLPVGWAVVEGQECVDGSVIGGQGQEHVIDGGGGRGRRGGGGCVPSERDRDNLGGSRRPQRLLAPGGAEHRPASPRAGGAGGAPNEPERSVFFGDPRGSDATADDAAAFVPGWDPAAFPLPTALQHEVVVVHVQHPHGKARSPGGAGVWVRGGGHDVANGLRRRRRRAGVGEPAVEPEGDAFRGGGSCEGEGHGADDVGREVGVLEGPPAADR